ncbi:MAG: hypothetical protein QOJ00_1976 [Actinomycetota bacterium]
MGDEHLTQGRDQLVTLVRRQTAETDCCQRAETVLRAEAMRARFATIGIAVTPEICTSLMAAAMLLASTSEEWGGDYRDALADLAALGLELFDT